MSTSLLTKKALAQGLKQMMNETPLGKITVQQVADTCGVNRQTFYYHFQDIYELLGWIYETEAVAGIAAYRSYDTWTDGFLRIFHYIENNKAVCLNTLHSLAKNHLEAYLHAVTNDLILGVIQELSVDLDVRDTDKKFMANFYTMGFVGLIMEWLAASMTEKPEVLIANLNLLIEGNFIRALHRYADKNP